MRRISLLAFLAFAVPPTTAAAAPSRDSIGGVALQIDGQPGKAKSIKGIRVDDGRPGAIDVRIMPVLGTPQFDWIAGALRGDAAPKTATLLWHTPTFYVGRSVEARGTEILEIEFPGSDAKGTRESAELRVRLQPNTLAAGPEGQHIAVAKAPAPTLAFTRFRVDGIPSESLARVVKVAPFTVRVTDSGAAPFVLDVVLGEGDEVEPWEAWAQRELVDAQPVTRRNGRLEYFDELPNAKTRPIVTVELEGMRIKSFEHSKWGGEGGSQARVTFGFEVQGVRLKGPSKTKPGKTKKFPK